MQKKYQFLDSNLLKLIAMIAMLIDHIGYCLFPEILWLRYIGRIAFPIFAFQIVEGYFHTKNKNKYALRLFVFALLTEIPFDLGLNYVLLEFTYQNVLFTLLCGVLMIHHLERGLQRKGHLKTIHFIIAIVFLSIPFFIKADYGYLGTLTIFVFYAANKMPEIRYLIMLVGLSYLHIFDSTSINVPFLFTNLQMPIQGYALGSIIPIFLYNGTQTKKLNTIRKIGYWFYPIHLLILFFIQFAMK